MEVHHIHQHMNPSHASSPGQHQQQHLLSYSGTSIPAFDATPLESMPETPRSSPIPSPGVSPHVSAAQLLAPEGQQQLQAEASDGLAGFSNDKVEDLVPTIRRRGSSVAEQGLVRGVSLVGWAGQGLGPDARTASSPSPIPSETGTAGGASSSSAYASPFASPSKRNSVGSDPASMDGKRDSFRFFGAESQATADMALLSSLDEQKAYGSNSSGATADGEYNNGSSEAGSRVVVSLPDLIGLGSHLRAAPATLGVASQLQPYAQATAADAAGPHRLPGVHSSSSDLPEVSRRGSLNATPESSQATELTDLTPSSMSPSPRREVEVLKEQNRHLQLQLQELQTKSAVADRLHRAGSASISGRTSPAVSPGHMRQRVHRRAMSVDIGK